MQGAPGANAVWRATTLGHLFSRFRWGHLVFIARGKPLSISHMDGHRTRASELGPKRPGCQPQTCRPEAFTLRLKTLFTVMCFRDEVLCFFAQRPTARPKAKYFRLPWHGQIGLALVGEVQGFTCRRWANVCFRLGLRACSSPR